MTGGHASVAVHTIGAGMGCAHLLAGESGLFLVDAGSSGYEAAILQRMDALGRHDLKLILITHAHFDHYGSAAALRRATGAPVAIHRQDAEAMACGLTLLGTARGRGRLGLIVFRFGKRYFRAESTPADVLFEDGYDLGAYGLDALLVHTPGHTVGSCSLLVDRRLLFAGDLLSRHHRLSVQPYYAQDWSLLEGSARRVQDLRPDWVYTGHGRQPLPGEALRALRTSP